MGDALDLEQAAMLRSWFVAHIDIQPHQPKPRRQPSRRQPQDARYVQLSLLG